MIGLRRRRTKLDRTLDDHAQTMLGIAMAHAQAAEVQPDFSEDDQAALELAAGEWPALDQLARDRAIRLAALTRQQGRDVAWLLGHHHWMAAVHEERVFPASTWGRALAAVLGACHLLHTGAIPPPVSDACHELNGGGDE